MSEQFGKLCRVNASGDKVLHIQDVKDAIGLSQPWFDELLLRIAGNEVSSEPIVVFWKHIYRPKLSWIVFFKFSKTNVFLGWRVGV